MITGRKFIKIYYTTNEFCRIFCQKASLRQYFTVTVILFNVFLCFSPQQYGGFMSTSDFLYLSTLYEIDIGSYTPLQELSTYSPTDGSNKTNARFMLCMQHCVCGVPYAVCAFCSSVPYRERPSEPSPLVDATPL